MTDLVVRRADLGAGRLADVRVRRDRVVAVAPELEVRSTDELLDAGGCGLIPGLHDHHVHLYGWAASQRSLVVGPPEVHDHRALVEAMVASDRNLPADAWLRGVGYHESVAGALDRHSLDALLPGRPVRIQHRSGAQWILNSAGLERLPAAVRGDPRVERDREGQPTGRLSRMDERLAQAWEPTKVDLAEVSALALQKGVTAFTDATPFSEQCKLSLLAEAKGRGEIVQHVTVMSAPGAHFSPPAGIRTGPVKVLLDDMTLPTFDELKAMVIDAHSHGRPVAVHCVTGVQTVLTLSVLSDAGTMPGDRMEHGALIAPELIPELERLGVTVVTNPGFVHERGDNYLVDVDPRDLDDLYRCDSLRRVGVNVLAGTDAPFGPADPWHVARTAATRQTASGTVLGENEAVPRPLALSLFFGGTDGFFGGVDGQGCPQLVAPGAASDLVVLSVPLDEALKSLSADNVAACIVGGRVALDRR
jgi:predicted amidohydrolase YtcJ